MSKREPLAKAYLPVEYALTVSPIVAADGTRSVGLKKRIYIATAENKIWSQTLIRNVTTNNYFRR